MRIILTGFSGFIGKYIDRYLVSKGHEVIHVGRKNVSESNNFIYFDCETSTNIIVKGLGKVDIVIFAAGLAHQNKKIDSQRFEDINATAPLRILDALKDYNNYPSVVYLSSVSVYGRHQGNDISETHVLAASDAYGKSKISGEKNCRRWSVENNVNCLILRLPLVAGECPPGNLGAIIEAVFKRKFVLFGAGRARKSWVYAGDIGPITEMACFKSGVYNLAYCKNPSMFEIVQAIAEVNMVPIPHAIPNWLAKALGKVGDTFEYILPLKLPVNSEIVKKLSSTLTFSCSKAVSDLEWDPTNPFEIKEIFVVNRR